MVLSALHFEAPYLFAAFYPSLLSVHFFCWLKLGDKKIKKCLDISSSYTGCCLVTFGVFMNELLFFLLNFVAVSVKHKF